jgi:hypothetical protein
LLTDAEFFLSWLPNRLEELGAAQRILVPVTIQVEVAAAVYSISVGPGSATVGQEPLTNPTFRVRLDTQSFERLLGGAESMPLDEGPVLRMMSLDREAIELVTQVSGCLEARFEEGEETYRLIIGPGHVAEVGCTISCALSDIEQVRAGKVQPIELLMNGKLRIDGDPQIALALGSLLT